MKDTKEVLFDNCSVWAFNVSTETFTDTLKPEDLGKTSEDIPEYVKLGKKNLADDLRVTLGNTRNDINRLMERIGTRFFLPSAWVVPNAKVLLAQEGLKIIEDTLQAKVEDVILQLEEVKQSQISKYGDPMENAKWPTAEQIRTRCTVKKHVFTIGSTSVKETDAEDIIAAKQKLQAELEQEFDELKKGILKEAHEAIIDACAEITEKINVTGGKITEATLKKPKKVIEQYLGIAEIFDHAGIKEAVLKLKEVVDVANAKQLRDDAQIQNDFAEALANMGKNIGDLAGINTDGKMKRRVIFEAEKKEEVNE